MGEKGSSRVASSWAPWAGPIYPHSSVSSNLTSTHQPLYQQLCLGFCTTVPNSWLDVGTLLRFISDIWSRHVEVCTTHLVPVCVLGLFLHFLPPAGLSTLSTVELPLHLRRHRHLSTITRTHKHIYLNINKIQKQNMQIADTQTRFS